MSGRVRASLRVTAVTFRAHVGAAILAVIPSVHVGVAIRRVMPIDRSVQVRGSFAGIGARPYASVLILVPVDDLYGRVLIRGWRGNVAQVLAVAASLLENIGAHAYEPAASLLLCAAALRAETQHDLVTGSASVSWPAKHVPSHREQRSIVVQHRARAAPKLVHGLAKKREGLWLHLETQHMAPLRQRSRSSRFVARALALDDPFQLSNGLAGSDLKPGSLGLGDGDAGELAHGGPAERARFERAGHERQRFEGLGDAQLFLYRARFVTE